MYFVEFLVMLTSKQANWKFILRCVPKYKYFSAKIFVALKLSYKDLSNKVLLDHVKKLISKESQKIEHTPSGDIQSDPPLGC